jgi:hypothetical protein
MGHNCDRPTEGADGSDILIESITYRTEYRQNPGPNGPPKKTSTNILILCSTLEGKNFMKGGRNLKGRERVGEEEGEGTGVEGGRLWKKRKRKVRAKIRASGWRMGPSSWKPTMLVDPAAGGIVT